MSISLRIKDLRKDKKLTQKEFSDIIGVDNSQLSKIERGQLHPTIEQIMEISSNFNISTDYLIKGIEQSNINSVNEPSIEYVKSIPLIEGKAIGGFWNSKFSIEERDIKAYYVIPKFQHKKVDFMIEVEGSSMYPKYNSGDVVACRIINEQSFIQWNKTHVIATKDQGIIIKRIKKGENGSLLMVSDNKDYDPFPVPTEEIEGIALVVGVIRLE